MKLACSVSYNVYQMLGSGRKKTPRLHLSDLSGLTMTLIYLALRIEYDAKCMKKIALFIISQEETQ